jgi:acetate kinase
VELDPQRNAERTDRDRDIGASAGGVPVLVIGAREELAAAAHAERVLTAAASG